MLARRWFDPVANDPTLPSAVKFAVLHNAALDTTM